jgi:hypothetical protein
MTWRDVGIWHMASVPGVGFQTLAAMRRARSDANDQRATRALSAAIIAAPNGNQSPVLRLLDAARDLRNRRATAIATNVAERLLSLGTQLNGRAQLDVRSAIPKAFVTR